MRHGFYNSKGVFLKDVALYTMIYESNGFTDAVGAGCFGYHECMLLTDPPAAIHNIAINNEGDLPRLIEIFDNAAIRTYCITCSEAATKFTIENQYGDKFTSYCDRCCPNEDQGCLHIINFDDIAMKINDPDQALVFCRMADAKKLTENGWDTLKKFPSHLEMLIKDLQRSGSRCSSYRLIEYLSK